MTFSRNSGENVGSYLITPSGLTSVNFAITFNTGVLTIIAPAPQLLALSLTAPANVLVRWTSVSNATYRVQYQSDLGSTNWTDLPGDVTAVASTASKADALTATNRFYRVRVLP